MLADTPPHYAGLQLGVNSSRPQGTAVLPFIPLGHADEGQRLKPVSVFSLMQNGIKQSDENTADFHRSPEQNNKKEKRKRKKLQKTKKKKEKKKKRKNKTKVCVCVGGGGGEGTLGGGGGGGIETTQTT